MARKKKARGEAEGGTDAAQAQAGGKSMTVPAIIVAVAVLAAGFMMKGGGGAAAAAPAPEPTEEAVHEGPVVETEPMTLNLADGHYLKVGIALQMAAPEEGEAAAHGGGHGGGEEDTGPPTAKALDLAITAFSSHTKEELSDAKERAKVKEHLTSEIAEAYHGEVVDIYFTQFVMQ